MCGRAEEDRMELLQKVERAVKDAGSVLQYKPLLECKELCGRIEQMCSQATAAYMYYSILYQKRYFEDVYDMYYDCSMIFISEGRACGIWPLCVYAENGNLTIGSNGARLLPPVLADEMGNKETRRKHFQKCIDFLFRLKEILGARIFPQNIIMETGLTQWQRKLLESNRAGRISGCNAGGGGGQIECFVDLSLSDEMILKNTRKSNKYSLRQAEKLWKYRIVTKADPPEEIERCFTVFRDLHIHVAGRETRSVDTWNIQCEAVKETNNFVVLLYDAESQLVGAALFETSRYFGVYAVAAYKRELFDKPLGHLSQWAAIRYMKSLGIKWYYVGRRFYSTDWDFPTDKEVAIGHFKEGFSTHLYYNMCLELK